MSQECISEEIPNKGLNDKGHNSYWIYVGLYVDLLVWRKI
jgi:hypothetical protein